METDKLKILVTDDHTLFRKGTMMLLETFEGIEFVDEAKNGKEALQKLSETPFDLILLDLEMPVMDGIEACRTLADKHPDKRILILTQHNDPDFIRSLATAGAQGYILKNTGKAELINAINAVMNDQNHYGQEVVNALVSGIRNHKKVVKKEEIAPDLTSRELEVLRLIVQEFTAHQIADKLFISQHTVDTHRKNLLSKLGVKNTAGLVRHAVKSGLVD